jgi:hypothetical protein
MNIEVGNLKEFLEQMKREREKSELVNNIVGSEWKKLLPYNYADVKFYQVEKDSQDVKADSGKPNLSLVPKQIIYEMEKVRAFGVNKYKDPENWRKVEIERYHQALLRHTLAVWDDINARDKESGLLHLSHIATNVAFILELMNEKE